MELFSTKLTLNFMGYRKLAVVFSGVLIAISIASLATRGLDQGIDFTGGTLIELGYEQDADLDQVREQLAEIGFPEAVVQRFGTPRDVLVRIAAINDGTAETDATLSNKILDGLPGSQMRRVEFVGPQVGEELTEQGGIAMLIALGCILVYVMLRFEWRFALGSVAALVHDVVIVLGVMSVVGIEFDLPVLAALLAVVGYSLNDTIVVFDRIRENFRRIRKGTPVEVVNSSLNQTLSRTVMTSLTTLLVLSALFFLGGEAIHAFAAALIIGVFTGTYSSIYVASTVALALGVNKADLMPVKKEGVDDARP